MVVIGRGAGCWYPCTVHLDGKGHKDDVADPFHRLVWCFALQ